MPVGRGGGSFTTIAGVKHGRPQKGTQVTREVGGQQTAMIHTPRITYNANLSAGARGMLPLEQHADTYNSNSHDFSSSMGLLSHQILQRRMQAIPTQRLTQRLLKALQTSSVYTY